MRPNKLASPGGLIEVEGFTDDNDRYGDTSDIVLATVGLGLAVDLLRFVKGHLLFLWEEGGTEPMEVDVCYLSVASPHGLSVVAGRMYIPFGVLCKPLHIGPPDPCARRNKRGGGNDRLSPGFGGFVRRGL